MNMNGTKTLRPFSSWNKKSLIIKNDWEKRPSDFRRGRRGHGVPCDGCTLWPYSACSFQGCILWPSPSNIPMAPSKGVPYDHGPFSLSKMKHYGLQHRPFRLTWGFLQSMLRATAHPAVVTIASCHIGIAIVPRNVFFGNNGQCVTSRHRDSMCVVWFPGYVGACVLLRACIQVSSFPFTLK